VLASSVQTPTTAAMSSLKPREKIGLPECVMQMNGSLKMTRQQEEDAELHLSVGRDSRVGSWPLT
jgi:hypothetical protein